MRIDVILESNSAPDLVAELGKLAEGYGLGGVWVSNMNDARDPFINFVNLAYATERIHLGPIAVSRWYSAVGIIRLNIAAKRSSWLMQ